MIMPASRLPIPTGGFAWSAVAAPTPAPQPKAPVWERLSKPRHAPPVKPQGKDDPFGPCDGEARYPKPPKPRWAPVGGRPVTKVADKKPAPSVNQRRAAKKPSSMATKIDWSTSKSVRFLCKDGKVKEDVVEFRANTAPELLKYDVRPLRSCLKKAAST